MFQFIHLNAQQQLADHTQGVANTHQWGGGAVRALPQKILSECICVCPEMENNRAKILNLVDCCISIIQSSVRPSSYDILDKHFCAPHPPPFLNYYTYLSLDLDLSSTAFSIQQKSLSPQRFLSRHLPFSITWKA